MKSIKNLLGTQKHPMPKEKELVPELGSWMILRRRENIPQRVGTSRAPMVAFRSGSWLQGQNECSCYGQHLRSGLYCAPPDDHCSFLTKWAPVWKTGSLVMGNFMNAALYFAWNSCCWIHRKRSFWLRGRKKSWRSSGCSEEYIPVATVFPLPWSDCRVSNTKPRKDGFCDPCDWFAE